MKFMNDYIIWDTKSLDYTMERFHKRNRVSGLIKFEFLPLLKQRTKQGRILGWSAIQLAEPDTVVNHCSYSLFPFAPFSSHFGTVHIAHVQGLVVWSLDLFVWRHLAQMCHDVAILGTVEKKNKAWNNSKWQKNNSHALKHCAFVCWRRGDQFNYWN